MLTTAKACRFGDQCAPATWKQYLTCRLQHHPDLKLETIADRAQIRRDRLYAYCNENQTDKIPAEALFRLCAVVGWDLLDYQLRTYDRVSAALPGSAASGDVLAEACEVAIAGADVLRRVKDCGRSIDDRERNQILNALAALEHESADVRAALTTPATVIEIGRNLERAR